MSTEHPSSAHPLAELVTREFWTGSGPFDGQDKASWAVLSLSCSQAVTQEGISLWNFSLTWEEVKENVA